MKARMGWVSNSSTTSFVIMGVPIDTPRIEVDDIPSLSTPQIEDLRGFWTEEAINTFREADWRSNDLESVLRDEFGLEHVGDEDGNEYIGIENDMNDDETLGQFKDRAMKAIKRVLVNPKGIDFQVGIISC